MYVVDNINLLILNSLHAINSKSHNTFLFSTCWENILARKVSVRNFFLAMIYGAGLSIIFTSKKKNIISVELGKQPIYFIG